MNSIHQFSSDFLTRLGSIDLYLDTTLLVALAGVVWTFARRIAQELYFLLSLRTREIELVLEAKGDIPDTITSLNMLFIRYGNDTYLSTIASDQERYHGRLRNKVIRVANAPPRHGEPIRVKIRVHKRLGTQFKFFVEAVGDPDPVIAYLKSHDTISDVSCQERPPLHIGDPVRHRCFFLVDRLAREKTVEGFTNNFIYPV